MTCIGIVIAAALMSGIGLTSTMAQAQFSEPAAFQAQYPNRDVLNGGRLNSAGSVPPGQYEGAGNAYAAQGYPLHSRRHRRYR